MKNLTMSIDGMSCGGCVTSVRTALSKSAGVIDAQVKIGEAKVSYDPILTSPETLRGVVTQAGYAVAAA